MRDLDPATAAATLSGVSLNRIRRGVQGLVMSNDRWRLIHSDDAAFTFKAEPPVPPDLEPFVIHLDEVERITWDRLARQQVRSQVRFHLKNGDVLTFSGHLPDPA